MAYKKGDRIFGKIEGLEWWGEKETRKFSRKSGRKKFQKTQTRDADMMASKKRIVWLILVPYTIAGLSQPGVRIVFFMVWHRGPIKIYRFSIKNYRFSIRIGLCTYWLIYVSISWFMYLVPNFTKVKFFLFLSAYPALSLKITGRPPCKPQHRRAASNAAGSTKFKKVKF